MDQTASVSWKSLIRRIFFFLGLTLFAYVIYRLNPSVLLEYLRAVGWNFFFILLISVFWYASYTWAWEIFLKNVSQRVHFWEVFKIKIAGEAINSITPLSWGGGDPARILMLREHIPATEGTASVVVDRTLNNLAIALFMLIGVLITLIKFRLSPSLFWSLLLSLGLIVGVSLFTYLRSHTGLLEFFINVAKKLHIKRHFTEQTLKHVREVDSHISNFYKMNKKGFLLAFLLHFFGKLCGVFEIYYAAQFLGHPLGLLDSYLLASMTVIVNMIFVFIPGTFGVLEGAYAGVFALMHLSPAVGTSIQIIRRARMVFWTALGFLFMARMKGNKQV